MEAAAKQKGGKKNASKPAAKKGVGPKGKGATNVSTTKVSSMCPPHHTPVYPYQHSVSAPTPHARAH